MAKSAKDLKVVVLDDETDVEKAIRDRLPKSLSKNVETVLPKDIKELVSQLGKRIATARKKKLENPNDTILDDADLFIVDYDLIEAKGEDYLTGETVAYLARCYSQCGVIVGLNQFHRRPTFDLTLRPQLNSFADLNISAEDLRNGGLWSGAPWKGYRPWHWPVLPNLVDLMRERVEDVEQADLKMIVSEFFELPKSVIERIPTVSLELLGGRGAPEKATLGDILTSPVLGLRGKEGTKRKRSSSLDARVLAARLSCWLNTVLAPQDVLVDAPHLASRCPSLVGSSVTTKSLAKTTKIESEVSALRTGQIDGDKFKKSFWFDRPVWFWPEIERRKLVTEIKDPWKQVKGSFVFCEDASAFRAKSTSKSFQCDLASPYRTRYVNGAFAGVEYQPQHRLALA